MRRTRPVITICLTLSLTLLAGATVAQGRGMGRGRGGGMGMGMGMGRVGGMGMGCGARMCGGQGREAGFGGWWNRVTPTTAQQKAFVSKAAALHDQIRVANRAIATLRAQRASQEDVAAKQGEVTRLRNQLADLTRSNAALLKELGVPAGCGVCDGAGPKPACPYAGPGRGGNGVCPYAGRPGRGNGMGLRDGSGPNPNCPLKSK